MSQLSIYTVISPDKLSMSMFSDFFQSVIGGMTKIIDINCLTSKSIQESIFEEAQLNLKNISNILVRYKTKHKTVIDLPVKISENSNCIIKFDLFSTHPEVIKDTTTVAKALLERWVVKVSQMDEIA